MTQYKNYENTCSTQNKYSSKCKETKYAMLYTRAHTVAQCNFSYFLNIAYENPAMRTFLLLCVCVREFHFLFSLEN